MLRAWHRITDSGRIVLKSHLGAEHERIGKCLSLSSDLRIKVGRVKFDGFLKVSDRNR
jgi:hypothetical protein